MREVERPRLLTTHATHIRTRTHHMFHDLALPATADAFAARDRAAAAARLGYSVVAVEVEATGRGEDM